MDGRILVTGGTGTIGRRLVPLLEERGAAVRVLTRHAPEGAADHVAGDVMTGAGLDVAMAGAAVVVHLAGAAKGDEVAAANVIAAAERAGVRHVLTLSVVGAGRMPIGYFRAKEQVEAIFAAATVPSTVLRAAQVHQLVLRMAAGMTRPPVAPAPRIRLEPVDAGEVAERLAELALGSPAGLACELAGAEVLEAEELLRRYAEVRGLRRRFVRFGLPGKVGAAYRADANLAGPDARRGHLTWEEFLRTEPLSVA
ncbi:SDR family oxidoreductase [Leifsonia sp. EB34]|uniref:SDR family oxidoreductase n=1 Tax=Leifsonia sp. EB34 TaxID=3156303 RepID=UPI003514A866